MGFFDSIGDIFSGSGSLLGNVVDIAGTGIGLYSDYKSGKEAKKSAEDQADSIIEAAENNRQLSLYDASVSEKEAIEAFKSNQRNLKLHYRMADSLLGAQTVSYAKGGAVASTGTPIDVMEQTAIRLGEDARIIQYEGKKAVDQRKSLAHRYRLLADAGLRDASATAALIEKTGDYKSDAFDLQMIQRIIG